LIDINVSGNILIIFNYFNYFIPLYYLFYINYFQK